MQMSNVPAIEQSVIDEILGSIELPDGIQFYDFKHGGAEPLPYFASFERELRAKYHSGHVMALIKLPDWTKRVQVVDGEVVIPANADLEFKKIGIAIPSTEWAKANLREQIQAVVAEL